MDKPFNQNLSTSGDNGKASQDFQSLEQRLELSEARSHCLLATLSQMAWFAQVNGAITNFNQQWYEYTGLTVGESLGWKFFKAIHPEDRDSLRDSYGDFRLSSVASASQVQAVKAPRSLNLNPESRGNRKPEETGEEQVDGFLGEPLPASYFSSGFTAKSNATPDQAIASLAYTAASSNLEPKKLQNTEIECRIRGKDGAYRWFIARKIPVFGGSGQLLEWIGTFTLKRELKPYTVTPLQQSAEAHTHQTPSQLQVELTSQLSLGKRQPTKLRVREQAKQRPVELVQHHQPKLPSELSQAIIWEAEATTGQFTFVSQSAERLLGYPVEQWLTQPDFWTNLVHPEDRQWTVALYRRQMLQSQDCELEYRCIAADNRVVWLRDRACVIRDEQGQVYKRRGLMVDITFAKRAETELHTRLCQQSAITQLTQSALLATEVSALLNESVALVSQALAVEYCNVLEWLPDNNNLRMRSGIGWSPGLVGQAIIEASPNTQAGYTLHSGQAVVVENLHRETRFQGSPLLHEHDIVSGISVIIPVGQNQENDEGRSPTTPKGSFGVLGAYTSRRRVFSQGDVEFLQAVANVLAGSIESQRTHESLDKARTQLAQATVALEKRTQELDQFAYIASHDLKAPLRAIANLSEWIEEDIFDQLNEDNQYQMQLLRGRVHRLEALIDGMQHYSRAGRITGTPERVDVEALLKQVIETLTPPPEFIIEVAPGMPTLVTMRSLLEQVFTQLIDNAIKHHPKADGQVKISVQEQLEAYEFAVTDNGAGIAPQFHERVFVIFQTLQARDEVENTGVGLAIAKRIVEGQGGTIRLESQEGQGTTVYFTWSKSLSES